VPLARLSLYAKRPPSSRTLAAEAVMIMPDAAVLNALTLTGLSPRSRGWPGPLCCTACSPEGALAGSPLGAEASNVKLVSQCRRSHIVSRIHPHTIVCSSSVLRPIPPPLASLDGRSRQSCPLGIVRACPHGDSNLPSSLRTSFSPRRHASLGRNHCSFLWSFSLDASPRLADPPASGPIVESREPFR